VVQQNIDRSLCGSLSFGGTSCGAAQMGPQQRRDLFLEALGRTEPLTHLAARQAVSRKFVYQQMAKATAVVDQAFQPAAGPESEVLFQLPVTQDWLEQLVLSLTLSCHRRLLRNQRTVLLAFVEVLQEKLAQVAQRFAVPLATVPALCEIEALDPQFDLYWQRTARWQTILKDQWYPIHQAVLAAMARTPRASSLVDNVNSRLRG
jgi:hypothetical protein